MEDGCWMQDKKRVMTLVIMVSWGVLALGITPNGVSVCADDGSVIGEREQEGIQALDGKRKQDKEQIEDYRIGVGDILRVVAWKELDIKVMVRPDGKISLPVVGEVVAWDKTPRQLSEELSELAKTDVVVILEEMAEMSVRQARPDGQDKDEEKELEVIILGEVEKPGVYNARTVYELIARAGGFAKGANKRSVFLYQDGWVESWNLDDGEVLLKDGDLVWVEESAGKRIADTVSFLYKPVQFFVLVWALLK